MTQDRPAPGGGIPGPPLTELYGAFLEAWHARDFAEAHYYLDRCRQSIEGCCGHDQTLVALVRRIDALLTRRQDAGPRIDDEVAAAIVAFRHAMTAHLK